ncbi:MAG TPA: NHL repeat-containing protein [bacterium]|nr:NHL repeat-containing protein [bacterium]
MMKSAGRIAAALLAVLALAWSAAALELRGHVLGLSIEHGFVIIDLGANASVRAGDMIEVLDAGQRVVARARVFKVYPELSECNTTEVLLPRALQEAEQLQEQNDHRTGLLAVRRDGTAGAPPATPPTVPAAPPAANRPPQLAANAFVATLVRTLALPGIIEHPVAVTVGADKKIYFTDTRHHALMAWHDERNSASPLPTGTMAVPGSGIYFGRGQGQFICPSALASDTAGQLYVVDTLNHRLQVIDRSGRVRRVTGELNTRNGQFINPFEMAVNPLTGTTFVADTKNNRVQQFSNTNTYVKTIVPADGFRRPAGLVFTNRQLFVVDGGRARVVIFDIDGNPLASFGEGVMVAPRGLATDGRGLLYVADPGAGRVLIYNLGGVLQGSISGAELSQPFGVACSPDGSLVVADPATNALLVYRVARRGTR